MASAVRYKVFNDSIHGAMELHPLSARIIDTVEYQRLRRLKQLGGAYAVFPAASHNRFEHSLGVAWMAQRFVKHLGEKQPTLGITPVEELCVEVAGLVHDLGHGVMSHMFDMKFIPKMRGEGERWSHEWASVRLLDLLWRNNPEVREEGLRWGVGPEQVHFIQQLVLGDRTDKPDDFEWRDPSPARHFLYEIVANKRSSIDVDKWDYFQRDSRQLGVAQSFDHGRLMLLARVVEDEQGVTTIAYPVKESWGIYQMFQTRFNLHKKAYQHRVARIVEFMAMEALVAADPFIRLPGGPGSDPRGVRMSDSINDMVAYTALNDSIMDRIQFSTEGELQPARDILKAIAERRHFHMVGETVLPAVMRDFRGSGSGSGSGGGGGSGASGSSVGMPEHVRVLAPPLPAPMLGRNSSTSTEMDEEDARRSEGAASSSASASASASAPQPSGALPKPPLPKRDGTLHGFGYGGAATGAGLCVGTGLGPRVAIPITRAGKGKKGGGGAAAAEAGGDKGSSAAAVIPATAPTSTAAGAGAGEGAAAATTSASASASSAPALALALATASAAAAASAAPMPSEMAVLSFAGDGSPAMPVAGTQHLLNYESLGLRKAEKYDEKKKKCAMEGGWEGVGTLASWALFVCLRQGPTLWAHIHGACYLLLTPSLFPHSSLFPSSPPPTLAGRWQRRWWALPKSTCAGAPAGGCMRRA